MASNIFETMIQDHTLNLLNIGLQSVQEYLAFHVLLCLIPAFFMAGAIASLFSKESVLKYFGADTPKYLSYSVASVSGLLLAVCSCTVLPLFAGIFKRGAGIGPATTFLFSAPAINILAIVYTAQILGYDMGAARALVAIPLSIVIGLIMAAVYESKRARKDKGGIKTFNQEKHSHTTRFFLLLLAILVLPMIIQSLTYLAIAELILVSTTVYFAFKWYSAEERKSWMEETWFLVKMIAPLLLVGVFFAGIIVELLPAAIVAKYVGGDAATSYFIASIAAALMYFSTLTEVPIIDALTVLGMGKGQALAMLLAGPALSLPNMIVINRVMGLKKGFSYIALVVIVSMIAGLVFGYFLF